MSEVMSGYRFISGDQNVVNRLCRPRLNAVWGRGGCHSGDTVNDTYTDMHLTEIEWVDTPADTAEHKQVIDETFAAVRKFLER